MREAELRWAGRGWTREFAAIEVALGPEASGGGAAGIRLVVETFWNSFDRLWRWEKLEMIKKYCTFWNTWKTQEIRDSQKCSDVCLIWLVPRVFLSSDVKVQDLGDFRGSKKQENLCSWEAKRSNERRQLPPYGTAEWAKSSAEKECKMHKKLCKKSTKRNLNP